MSLVKIDLSGERQAGMRFEKFPSELLADLRAEIDSLTNELRGRVGAAMPRGTGELRDSLDSDVIKKEGRIRGRVIVAVGNSKLHRKAAALEYGSKGKKRPVRQHKMRLGHYWDEKLATPRTVIVKAFQRTPNVKAHKFLRGPMEAMRPTILARLGKVVERAAQEASE